MMVSFIQSNFMGFGSGVVVPGTGISLQNRGSGFTLRPGHANTVGPRKRPAHTIIPGFVLGKDGRALMALGVMGGPMQPQGHMQVVLRLVDHGDDPQAALDAPRWRVDGGLDVQLEPGLWGSLDQLAALGHRVRRADVVHDFGVGQAILRLGDALIGGSDGRGDGFAAGL
jgi:gamma-glutamyltranspeptidase/glutathione hydrolase